MNEMHNKIDTRPLLKKRRPLLPWIAAILGTLVAGSAIGWATATVLTPPAEVVNSNAYTYFEVTDAEVGSSINLNTVAAWSPIPVGSNLASGTVTTVNVDAGQEVGVGSVLYTVNLRPVVIAQGQIPSFRGLSLGATGADVSQLQSMLATLGFYEYEVDGKFDWVTQQAVNAWQESLGLSADGTVQDGDIVYVPSLPTRVSLDTDKVMRGASLGGGEEVVRGLTASPSFSIPVTSSQASLMPAGTRVEITGPNGEAWEGFVLEHVSNASDDGITVKLEGAAGNPICGDECSSIPVTDEALLRSRIVTVESVEGPAVPSAALLSSANGALSVIDKDGLFHPVSVLTSAKGMSIIEGVPVGTLVRVPATGG